MRACNLAARGTQQQGDCELENKPGLQINTLPGRGGRGGGRREEGEGREEEGEGEGEGGGRGRETENMNSECYL